MFTSYKKILKYSITKAQTSKGNKKQIINKQTWSSSRVLIFLPERETREHAKRIQSIIQGILFNGFTRLSVFKAISLNRRGDGGLEVLEKAPNSILAYLGPLCCTPNCLHVHPTVCTSVANLTSEIFTLNCVTLGHGGDNFVKSSHFFVQYT